MPKSFWLWLSVVGVLFCAMIFWNSSKSAKMMYVRILPVMNLVLFLFDILSLGILFTRFSMDEKQNIYYSLGAYTSIFYKLKPINEGLMPFKIVKGNKNRFGFIDEAGKIVVPAKYDFAYPFGRNGLALIAHDDKICAIDKTGKEVVPLGKYDDMGFGFKNGNNVACKGKTAYLINKEGNIIKELFTSKKDVVCNNYYYGDYLIIGEGEDTKCIYDCNGELIWKVTADRYSINAEKGTILLANGLNGKKVEYLTDTEIPYNW